ncbi:MULTISPECIES: hypothetical protein [unclassified Paracoccus (in: a-proteobacteria)]|uniref:hypothetical protein n=1 Tax=unclassified Paracoccus (in: a-proteobacteria) TaxID=2688777 RepID=UPI001F32139B|nr:MULTISPECIES: hypothetical protein [unclassified Paracoccus (in: a-proteobacteria)]QXL80120.1 hypothetical protein [Paracoccus sp. (in: a-proteobacteria)]
MNIAEDNASARDEVTYDIYLRLHATQHLYPAKTLRTVLSELFYADSFAWRAVGITREALNAYREAGKGRIKGIERAHLTDRHRMITHILKRDIPMSQDELFSYWRTHDRVVISLKSENRNNQLGDWIPFDNEHANYFTRLGIGFRYQHDIEGEMLQQLAEEMAGADRAEMQAATRLSFRTLPLPKARQNLDLSLNFDRRDYDKIISGLVPRDMEDRWFIFHEDERLYFHRSWSGYCIYSARLTNTPMGGTLSEAWVNADKEQYNCSEPEEEAKFIETLINNLLLARCT